MLDSKGRKRCGDADDVVRQGVIAIVLAVPLEISKEKATTVLKRGKGPASIS